MIHMYVVCPDLGAFHTSPAVQQVTPYFMLSNVCCHKTVVVVRGVECPASNVNRFGVFRASISVTSGKYYELRKTSRGKRTLRLVFGE